MLGGYACRSSLQVSNPILVTETGAGEIFRAPSPPSFPLHPKERERNLSETYRERFLVLLLAPSSGFGMERDEGGCLARSPFHSRGGVVNRVSAVVLHLMRLPGITREPSNLITQTLQCPVFYVCFSNELKPSERMREENVDERKRMLLLLYSKILWVYKHFNDSLLWKSCFFF